MKSSSSASHLSQTAKSKLDFFNGLLQTLSQRSIDRQVLFRLQDKLNADNGVIAGFNKEFTTANIEKVKVATVSSLKSKVQELKKYYEDAVKLEIAVIQAGKVSAEQLLEKLTAQGINRDTNAVLKSQFPEKNNPLDFIKKCTDILQMPTNTERKLLVMQKAINEAIASTKLTYPEFKVNEIKNPNKQEMLNALEKIKKIAMYWKATKAMQEGNFDKEQSKLDFMKKQGITNGVLAEYSKLENPEYLIQQPTAEQQLLLRRNEMEVINKFDSKKIGVNDPVLQTVFKAQLTAFFEMRQILDAVHITIGKILSSSEQHSAEYAKKEDSYPTMMRLFELASYTTIANFNRAYLFLGELNDECQKFLITNVTLDEVQAVVRKELPELDSLNNLPTLIHVARLNAMKNIGILLESLDSLEQYCTSKKINRDQILKMKKKFMEQVINEFFKFRMQDSKESAESMLTFFYHPRLKVMLASLKGHRRDDLTLQQSIDSEIKMGDLAAASFPDTSQSYPTLDSKTEKTKNQKKKARKAKAKLQSAPMPESKSASSAPKEQAASPTAKQESKKPSTTVVGLHRAKLPAMNLKDLKEVASFTFDESKEEKTHIQITKSETITAFFVAARQVMEDRKRLLDPKKVQEAYLLRNAFEHIKDLVDIAILTPGHSDQLNTFYLEIMKFARALWKYVETGDRTDLELCPFYHAAIKHGQELARQFDNGTREVISSDDTQYYLNHLSRQLMAYNIPERLPVTETIHNLATKGLATKFMTYAKLNVKEDLATLLKAEKHGRRNSVSYLPEIGLELTRQARRRSFSAGESTH